MNLAEIPNINKYALHYVFEDIKVKQNENTLWLEFGVADGININYFSRFTSNFVFGFDDFEGLPNDWLDDNNNIILKKGTFNSNGICPIVNNNVVLITNKLNIKLYDFLNLDRDKKISFVNINCYLYDSTKYILEKLYPFLDENCIFVFNQLVNIPNDSNELRALTEFIKNYRVSYKWIGMKGNPNMDNPDNTAVAIYLNYKFT